MKPYHAFYLKIFKYSESTFAAETDVNASETWEMDVYPGAIL